MLISLDIETTGTDLKKDSITIIGVDYFDRGKRESEVFNNIKDLANFFSNLPQIELLGHNFKFDIKFLLRDGLDLRPYWAHDTMLMSVAYSHKIPIEWLKQYEENRKLINKSLGKSIHREAKHHSLKSLAPYFLGIAPFWEVEDKQNKEYVLKDCIYTHDLFKFFENALKRDKTYDFYLQKLLSWDKMLLDIEIRGVKIDLDLLDTMQKECEDTVVMAEQQLQSIWSAHIAEYLKEEKAEIVYKYKEMESKAIEKTISTHKKGDITPKLDKINTRYAELCNNAINSMPNKLNLDSPEQIKWLFNKLQYNLIDDEGNETTGKAIIEKLIMEGKSDIELFKIYKKNKKLINAFFEAYKEKHTDSILYTNFNISGARTGRLSSNNPNLQQVPGNLHQIFVARPGYKLADYDMSGIEPNMIAYFSEDKALCEILIGGHDFHSTVTKALVEYIDCDIKDIKEKFPKERKLVKQVDLSLFYGSGLNRMLTTCKNHGFNWSEKDCRYKLRKFKQLFSGSFRFKEELDSILIDNHVPNILGRAIRIEDPMDIYMKGFNTLIQSSASDLVLQAAYNMTQEFKNKDIDAHVLLLVHDEIVIEIPENRLDECQEIIINNMTKFPLQTIHGDIQLQVEGKISDKWEK